MGSRFEVLWIEALEARDKNQQALNLARGSGPLSDNMNNMNNSSSSGAHPFAAMSIGEEGEYDVSAASHTSTLEETPSSSSGIAATNNTSSALSTPSGADVNFSVESGPYGGGNPMGYSSHGGSGGSSTGGGGGGSGGGPTLHGLVPPSADALFEAKFVATCVAAAASWASEDVRVGAWPKNKREAFVQVGASLFTCAQEVAAVTLKQLFRRPWSVFCVLFFFLNVCSSLIFSPHSPCTT